MMQSLLLILTGAVATLGFALIAASQAQHWPLLQRVGASPPAALRPVGWVVLAISMGPALMRDGPAFGLVLWMMMLTVAALLVSGGIVKLARRRHPDRR